MLQDEIVDTLADALPPAGAGIDELGPEPFG